MLNALTSSAAFFLQPSSSLAFPTVEASENTPADKLRAAGFTEIAVTLDNDDRALWCELDPTGLPSFTPALLRDLTRMQHILESELDWSSSRPIDFLVLASRTPEVFNLGGDLNLFSEKIEQADWTALRQYAHQCVEVIDRNRQGYGKEVLTIALIQGDALGGGFEAALSCDFLIAERHARMGFPEVLFNLFPGMGAFSLLSRRVGAAIAETMLRSGRIYTATELLELGVIDQIVESGQGRAAVQNKMRQMRGRVNAQSAISAVRRRVQPLTLAELKDVADIWVEAAQRLCVQDLRNMRRIAAAQQRARNRRIQATAPFLQ